MGWKMNKKTVLTIDIGNSTVVFGFFCDDKITRVKRYNTDDFRKKSLGVLEFSLKHCDGIIVSSVVPEALANLKNKIKKNFDGKVLILGENVEVPIKNLYKNPEQVGQDRLVCAYEAYSKYRQKLLVIDYGTAVTFDVVSGKGEYLGGVIVPGINVSFDALVNRAALLPKVKLQLPKNLIGNDTKEAMFSGIFNGMGALTDGLIIKIRKQFGKDMKVIATGGYSSVIKKYSTLVEDVDSDLILKGLRRIYR